MKTLLNTRITLFICDLPLRMALLTVAILASANIWEQSISILYILGIIAISLGLYLMIRLQSGFLESVPESNDIRLLFNNFKSEIKFVLGFLSLIYVFAYSSHTETVLTFIYLNIILQNIPVLISRMIVLGASYSHYGASNELGLKLGLKQKTALIYGTGTRAKLIANMLLSNPQSEITPTGFVDSWDGQLWRYRDIPLIGGIDEMKKAILGGQVDVLFIGAEDNQFAETQEVFSVAEDMGTPVCVLPQIYRTKISRCCVKTFSGQPALMYRSDREEGVVTVLKLVFDKIGAIVGIILTLPIMLFAGALIKITSPGPVIFRQKRCGKNGAPFMALKFRTMEVNAERIKGELRKRNEMSGPMFKIKDDPRITKVGKYLRKYSVDELPQLFNVLKGDMSLVGPRPALPSEVEKFDTWQRRKLAMKPGVTCIWQVSGRNSIDFDEWMKMDLEYIDNWSLWLDAKLLARTIPTVLKGTGH
ncbi:MAG: sugar transferase [candidate division Zixibacteria bacterium]|nr:sugar transferase [candidate division Zixibacteria bacterium]